MTLGSFAQEEKSKKSIKNFMNKVKDKVSEVVEVEKGDGKFQMRLKPISSGGNLGSITSPAYQKLMMEAIANKDSESLKKYIELGANPNLGEHHSHVNFPVVEAIKNDCMDCVNIIEPHLKDVNNVNGCTKMPLVAACNYSLDLCKKCVEEWGADVNGYAYHRKTAPPTQFNNRFNSKQQHMAISLIHRVESLNYLVDKGANARYGNPNVMQYAESFEPERLEAYLKGGAKSDYVFASHKSTSTDFGDRKTPLHDCLKGKKWGNAQVLLKYGANPNQLYQDKRPLYYAIRYNNLEVLKQLIKSGADLNQIIVYGSSQNYTALGYAADMSAQKEIIDFLIANGAR